MGKGANKQLLNNSGVAQSRSGDLAGKSDALYGFLDPTLQAEATNPQGYSKGDLGAMNTASQQSLGGSTAGVTGQANLESARTRNAGGFSGAIGTATRGNARQLSQNALQVQSDNARLKEAQKQQALSSLQGLYGVDTSTALGYLNSSNGALGEENNATGSHAPGFNLFKDFLGNAEKAGGDKWANANG